MLRPTETVHHFKDATGRYVEAINRLVATGITHGKTIGRFGTNDPVKRGEFAVMVARLSDPALSPPSSYSDLLSTQGGLTMKAEKENNRLLFDSAVRLTLIHTADFNYIYNRIYILEKKQGNQWLEIKYNNGLSFFADMLAVEAGKSQEVTISFDQFKTLMTPGKYRVRHTFYPSKNGTVKERAFIAAEFTITE